MFIVTPVLALAESLVNDLIGLKLGRWAIWVVTIVIIAVTSVV
jgi:hypothetical protein